MDSALGRQCGSIALFAKGTNAKFANLSQKAQSSHSPTAKQAIAVQGEAAAGFFRIPRILEEESGVSPSLRSIAESFQPFSLSLRADEIGVAIHKTTAQKVDSSSLSLRDLR